MKIKYLGHSSFLLTFDCGKRIVCDPYDGAIGFDMPKAEADAVTISHHHYDHDKASMVLGRPRILDGASGFNGTVGGVNITTVKCFHDEVNGAKRGVNTIFKFTEGDISVCHMGDLGENFNKNIVEKIVPCDVLLIPVGGRYTIDWREAEKYVNAIKPKLIIPMHYKVKGGLIDIADASDFLRAVQKDGMKVEEVGSEIQIDKYLCEECKVLVMTRAES